MSVYDAKARSQIADLKEIIDAKAALSLWEAAINSKWEGKSVWVHGDLASGNILIKDEKLSAVIDFGGMGCGDPASDLIIAWTFFFGESRRLFKEHVEIDDDTWIRARGWALWKATYELCQTKNEKYKRTIEDVLKEIF